MLMAGEGKRILDLNEKKPFLKIRNYPIYDFSFKKFGSKIKIIITNND